MSPKKVFIMSRKRRHFTDEYKAEVVNLISEIFANVDLEVAIVSRGSSNPKVRTLI